MNNRLFCAIVAILLSSGCALTGTSNGPANGPISNTATQAIGLATDQVNTNLPKARLAAVDLVNALMQIDGYHPADEPLLVRAVNSEFEREISAVLDIAGYKLTTTEQSDAPRLIKFYAAAIADKEHSQSYQIRVDDISLGRDYQQLNERTAPVSNLHVEGLSAASIKLNDHIFDRHPASQTAPNIDTLKDKDIATAKDTAAPQEIQASATVSEEPQETPEPIAENIDKDTLMPTTVGMWINGQINPKSFSRGEKLVVTVHSNNDVELFCYYRDKSDVIMRIYPNRFSVKSLTEAGRITKIPATDNWSIEAADSAATEELMCIASDPAEQELNRILNDTPDFEPLSVNSFEDLLAELQQTSGANPFVSRISIKTI